MDQNRIDELKVFLSLDDIRIRLPKNTGVV